MEFSAQVTFPAKPASVAEMLATEAYVLEKITSAGDTPGDVEIARSPDGGVTITTRREMPTTDVPANYRTFVGSRLEVHEVDVWEPPSTDGHRRGTLAIEVAGAPVRVTGTLELVPSTEHESTLHLRGHIKATIPFFGKAIEKALGESVDRAVDIERQVGLAWLARH